MLDAVKPELRVTVFSDYICPFCYIGAVRLARLEKEYDLKVNWCMVELHPESSAQGRPVEELGYSKEQWNGMMDELSAMAQAESIVIRPPTFTTNSHQALLLAEAAKEQGREVFYALHHGLFEACFGAGLNIGDTAVLQHLAANCGVTPDTVERAWTEPQYPTRLRHNLQAAQELSVTGTPTFFIGTNKLTGALSMETLRHAAHAAVPLS